MAQQKRVHRKNKTEKIEGNFLAKLSNTHPILKIPSEEKCWKRPAFNVDLFEMLINGKSFHFYAVYSDMVLLTGGIGNISKSHAHILKMTMQIKCNSMFLSPSCCSADGVWYQQVLNLFALLTTECIVNNVKCALRCANKLERQQYIQITG